MIGSTGRNSGKTTFASQAIKHFSKTRPVIGLKVTTINEGHACPRGAGGCGVCGAVKDAYELIEETNTNIEKDTSLLLRSGAKKVYWLKVKRPHLEKGIAEFVEKIDSESLIICESNALRNVVQPGMFLMIDNEEEGLAKPSAASVMHMADEVFKGDIRPHANDILMRIDL